MVLVGKVIFILKWITLPTKKSGARYGAYNTVYTQTQLNDLIIKVVIAEPDEAFTNDNNLAPDYNKEDFQISRVYNKLRKKWNIFFKCNSIQYI